MAELNPEISYFEKNGWVTIEGHIDSSPSILLSAKGRPRPGPGGEPAQVLPYGVKRVGGPFDGRGKHVWIIDTGIDLKHPDLNVGVGANFVAGSGTSPNDGNGHGTHVAGIIGAVDNSIDVVGVASGATVHPVRVLDNQGVGNIDAVIAGVDYVAANASPNDVVNMSLSASGHFQSLHDAIIAAANKGLRFSIAAGNYAKDASGYEPAHIEHPNVFTVSAIDTNDVFASFSNYGNPPIDYAAPGVSIVSTKLGGGVVSYSGTSMAAPHVAGLLTFGLPMSVGVVKNDPDGQPDYIAGY
jgi:subtilisin family serine protease